MSTLFYAKAEIDGAITKTDTEIIIPAVLTREGVLPYPKEGKRKYRSKEELRKALYTFNDCLVTISKHPSNLMRTETGNVIPIRNYLMKQEEIYGKVRNATLDENAVNPKTGKKSAALRGEIHLIAAKVDAELLSQIEKGILRNVSTGFTSYDDDEIGEWEGEAYDSVQKNIVANHIAILPPWLGRVKAPEIGLFVDGEEGVEVLDVQTLVDRVTILEAEVQALKKPLIQDVDRTVRPVNKDTGELIRELRKTQWQNR